MEWPPGLVPHFSFVPDVNIGDIGSVGQMSGDQYQWLRKKKERNAWGLNHRVGVLDGGSDNRSCEAPGMPVGKSSRHRPSFLSFPSSFPLLVYNIASLFLVLWPGAPSSVLAPSSDARSP